MSRSSVVPWWGRLLPWVLAVVAAGCLGWSLGIDPVAAVCVHGGDHPSPSRHDGPHRQRRGEQAFRALKAEIRRRHEAA